METMRCKARRLLSGSELGLSGSIAIYRLPGVTYRRLSTSIAPKQMVLTVNVTVKFFSLFCFGILPSSQYAERGKPYK